jgi:hypothetical protein
MPQVPTIGLECKAYRMTGGTWGSPTWTEMTSVIDVKIPIQRNLVIAKSRASVWEKALAGLLKAELGFNMLRDNDDAHQVALLAAMVAGTAVILAFCEGNIATAGNVFFKGEFLIGSFEEGEPLEDATTVDVMIKPSAKSSNEPGFFTAA